MDEICKNCWNEGCKLNEKLRQSKVDVCIDMHEHPEHWDNYNPFYIEEEYW